MRLAQRAIVALFGMGLLSAPLTAWAGADCTGTAATRQSVTTFSALLDGQPGTAGQPQVTLSASGNGDGSQVLAAYGFTPNLRRFACDMLLSLTLPEADFANSRVIVAQSVGLSWEQRWRADDANGPTLSTFAALQAPFRGGSHAAQLTITGVVARSFRPGTAYLNVGVVSEGGLRSGDWRRVALVGWRHDLQGGSAMVLDVGAQSDGTRFMEASLQIPISAAISLGPGVSWARSNGRTQTSVGVLLQRTLGLRPSIPQGDAEDR